MARRLRKVVIVMEVMTDRPVRDIRRAEVVDLYGRNSLESLLTCDVLQIDVNVVRSEMTRRRKK